MAAASTIVSVSGRGSKTLSEIVSGSPQNSRRPTILDRGSPATRRAANSASLSAVSPSGADVETSNAAGESPHAAHSASRASRMGSSIPERRNESIRRAIAAERVVEALKGRRSAEGLALRRLALKRLGRDSACTSCPTRRGMVRFGQPGPKSRGCSDRVRRRRARNSRSAGRR